MKRSRRKERFLGIPYHVVNSDEFSTLSAPETKLILDLLWQYTGRNNGALTPSHALLDKRGWASTSLYRAFVGLKKKGFVVVTRQGWKQRGRPTFVAVTFLGIDDCNIEFDEGIKASPSPLGYWRSATVTKLVVLTTQKPLPDENRIIKPIPYKRI